MAEEIMRIQDVTPPGAHEYARARLSQSHPGIEQKFHEADSRGSGSIRTQENLWHWREADQVAPLADLFEEQQIRATARHSSCHMLQRGQVLRRQVAAEEVAVVPELLNDER